MRRFLLPGGVFVTAALNVLSAGGAGQVSTPPTTRELLREIAQTTDAEWAAIARGEAVAKVLATDNREVAVAGAVRIAASSERFAGRYREIENLKRSAIVLDVGRFSTPPRPDDLLSVPFEDYDLDLRDCRPGDCRVRLGAPEIARFHREVDWRSNDWRERSRTVWREVLAGYAAAFSREGRRALPNFVNKPEPLSVPAELSLLVDRFGFVGSVRSGLPRLSARVRSWPGGARQGSLLEQGGFRRPAGPAPVAADDLPHAWRDPCRARRHQPDLCGPLSRRRAHGHDGDRRDRGRWPPGVRHDLGQPRAHAVAERRAPLVRARDGAEPQPRRAPEGPGVGEGKPRTSTVATRGASRSRHADRSASRN